MNYADENDIIEIKNDEEVEVFKEDTPIEEEVLEEKPIKKEKVKKNKVCLKDKWNSLPRKKKGIIIAVISLIIVLILALVFLFVLKKDDKDKKKEPDVVLEKDNYRYENGKLAFLDKSNNVLGYYECENKDTNKCMVMKIDYSKDTFDRVKSVDTLGNEIDKNIPIYLDKYVFVKDGDKSFIFDIKDKKELLNVVLAKSYTTKDDVVVIENEDNKYGLITFNEEGMDYLIRPSYDYLGVAGNKNILLAQDKDEYYLIDFEGKKLSKNIYGTVKGANDKYIIAVKNNLYNLYDYDFTELLSNYEYIGFYDKYIAFALSNRLYLRDNDLNMLEPDGIRLTSKDYVRSYVYDNGKLTETKKAFDITSEGTVVTVVVGDETKNIDVLDGKASGNYKYLSYFNGKLYFYSDEEKEELLGTYTCSNKNVISEENLQLSSCNIYNSEDGYTGIYNNDYVIIYDNLKGSDLIYYLYSIKEKKIKGTYSYVDVVSGNEISDEIHHINTNSSYLIARAHNGANKDNIGVLEITSTKVSGKVEFKYSGITYLNTDYYLMKNISNKVSLFNNTFTKISDDFDKIDVYANYYVGIDSNKLNVYNYLNKNKILKKDIDVVNNEYKIAFSNGFTITVGENTYKFDLLGNEIINNIENNEGNNNEET